MKIKISSPKASSRTLATGLHVLRPSGATRPRGRSALVVLRWAIGLEETLTPSGVRVSREGWVETHRVAGPASAGAVSFPENISEASFVLKLCLIFCLLLRKK